MKVESNFVRVFGDTPINRLWDFLIDTRGLFDFSMTDICEVADISWNTLKRIFPKFVEEGIVKETRKIGRATMYMLNENHPKSAFMINMHKAINMVFAHGGHFKLEVVVKNRNSAPVRLEITKSTLKPLSPKTE
ncbi:MAG: hypothetical protein DRP11_05190 [Candidatus Aenigmatarchaeota archaeon]|nr:MAG: hypothetical protein DRP11_05190 [Candidatus Aenigmarchaeota archaeon]